WEVRDEPLAVLATSPMALHVTQLFRQLSDDVTFLRHTAPAPSAEEAEALADLLAGIGLTATEHPQGTGERIEADVTGRTAVPGVWVAGNVTEIMAWVVAAASAGLMAAAAINNDLVAEETRVAVQRAAAARAEAA